ncbi:hypothetical protein [Aestuariivirga litoralis]|nr:hypothetical protein [Aestuariivirga litoralis]
MAGFMPLPLPSVRQMPCRKISTSSFPSSIGRDDFFVVMGTRDP